MHATSRQTFVNNNPTQAPWGGSAVIAVAEVYVRYPAYWCPVRWYRQVIIDTIFPLRCVGEVYKRTVSCSLKIVTYLQIDWQNNAWVERLSGSHVKCDTQTIDREIYEIERTDVISVCQKTLMTLTRLEICTIWGTVPLCMCLTIEHICGMLSTTYVSIHFFRPLFLSLSLHMYFVF